MSACKANMEERLQCSGDSNNGKEINNTFTLPAPFKRSEEEETPAVRSKERQIALEERFAILEKHVEDTKRLELLEEKVNDFAEHMATLEKQREGMLEQLADEHKRLSQVFLASMCDGMEERLEFLEKQVDDIADAEEKSTMQATLNTILSKLDDVDCNVDRLKLQMVSMARRMSKFESKCTTRFEQFNARFDKHERVMEEEFGRLATFERRFEELEQGKVETGLTMSTTVLE